MENIYEDKDLELVRKYFGEPKDVFIRDNENAFVLGDAPSEFIVIKHFFGFTDKSMLFEIHPESKDKFLSQGCWLCETWNEYGRFFLHTKDGVFLGGEYPYPQGLETIKKEIEEIKKEG